jgi:hypothetical protein
MALDVIRDVLEGVLPFICANLMLLLLRLTLLRDSCRCAACAWLPTSFATCLRACCC